MSLLDLLAYKCDTSLSRSFEYDADKNSMIKHTCANNSKQLEPRAIKLIEHLLSDLSEGKRRIIAETSAQWAAYDSVITCAACKELQRLKTRELSVLAQEMMKIQTALENCREAFSSDRSNCQHDIDEVFEHLASRNSDMRKLLDVLAFEFMSTELVLIKHVPKPKKKFRHEVRPDRDSTSGVRAFYLSMVYGTLISVEYPRPLEVIGQIARGLGISDSNCVDDAWLKRMGPMTTGPSIAQSMKHFYKEAPKTRGSVRQIDLPPMHDFFMKPFRKK